MKYKFLILLGLLAGTAAAQGKFSAGMYLGGGMISGNSPNIGSFTSSLFIDADIDYGVNVTTRFSFLFAGDFNMLLPDSRQSYNPYLKGFSVKGVYAPKMNELIYLEQGLGLLVLNDRTFSDTNVWDAGVVFSLAAGMDLRERRSSGFKVGAGAEYGITFFNTQAALFSIHLLLSFEF